MHETFWTLLGDPAHWEFEIFLMVIFDGLLIGILWPFLKKHWKHHVERDNWERNKSNIRAILTRPGCSMSGRHINQGGEANKNDTPGKG